MKVCLMSEHTFNEYMDKIKEQEEVERYLQNKGSLATHILI